jgi:hypothetical protein
LIRFDLLVLYNLFDPLIP